MAVLKLCSAIPLDSSGPLRWEHVSTPNYNPTRATKPLVDFPWELFMPLGIMRKCQEILIL